jgi:hypothetical protein
VKTAPAVLRSRGTPGQAAGMSNGSASPRPRSGSLLDTLRRRSPALVLALISFLFFWQYFVLDVTLYAGDWKWVANRFLTAVENGVLRQRIREVPVKTVYAEESSSIGFRASVVYGIATLGTLLKYLLHRAGMRQSSLFQPAELGRSGQEPLPKQRS